MLFPGSSHSSLQTLGKPLSLDPRTWHQMSLADPCCSMSPALALSLPGDRAFERSLSLSLPTGRIGERLTGEMAKREVVGKAVGVEQQEADC